MDTRMAHPRFLFPKARTGEPDGRSGSQRQRLGQTTRSTVTTHQKTVPAEMSGATASQLPIAPPPFGVNRILATAAAVGCVRESRTRRPPTGGARRQRSRQRPDVDPTVVGSPSSWLAADLATASASSITSHSAGPPKAEIFAGEESVQSKPRLTGPISLTLTAIHKKIHISVGFA